MPGDYDIGRAYCHSSVPFMSQDPVFEHFSLNWIFTKNGLRKTEKQAVRNKEKGFNIPP